MIKRIFDGTNRSRSLHLSNKETKLKNTITTFTNQHKFKKNEDFYKAYKLFFLHNYICLFSYRINHV